MLSTLYTPVRQLSVSGIQLNRFDTFHSHSLVVSLIISFISFIITLLHIYHCNFTCLNDEMTKVHCKCGTYSMVNHITFILKNHYFQKKNTLGHDLKQTQVQKVSRKKTWKFDTMRFGWLNSLNNQTSQRIPQYELTLGEFMVNWLSNVTSNYCWSSKVKYYLTTPNDGKNNSESQLLWYKLNLNKWCCFTTCLWTLLNCI